MKTIRKLNDPAPGLSDYLSSAGDDTDWDEFRSHDSGRSYKQLRDALAENQHGLCAYCEVGAREHKQIEHVIPRSDPQQGKERELDVVNMVACCMGGTVPEAGLNDAGDEGRHRKPRSHNVSCGQAKGNRNDEGFIDPRTLPAAPSLARVRENGRLEADESACISAGFRSDHMTRTIEILNLNSERLRLAREKRWNDLTELSEDIEDDPDEIRKWVRSVLTPDENGRLLPFFTTSRCYFESLIGGPLSEGILAEVPQEWI